MNTDDQQQSQDRSSQTTSTVWTIGDLIKLKEWHLLEIKKIDRKIMEINKAEGVRI